MVYCGPSPWHNVGKILMGKYKCPEHLVAAPPKNPEMVDQLPDKCKNPYESFLAIVWCQGYQHVKALLLSSRVLGASPKEPVCITLMEAQPNPSKVHWDITD